MWHMQLCVPAQGLYGQHLKSASQHGSRRVQRSDDTEDKARNRIQVYHDNVNAVTAYYKDQMVEVDGNTSMDDVFEQVVHQLDQVCAAQAAA